MATALTDAAVIAAVMAADSLPLTDTERWHAFDAKARREESRYQSAALALFAKERDHVITRILDNVPGFKSPLDPHPAITDPYVEAALLFIAADYAPGGRYHAAWLARYRRLIERTMQVGARGVDARVGLSFRLANPRAQAAIQRRVTQLTGNVTETTLQRIRDVIAQGRTEGIGITELTSRIREQAFGGAVTQARARTIARTETVGALNEGAFVAATSGGVMQAKRWLSQRDARVRDSHVDAEGEGWIAISGVFGNGLSHPHQAGAPAAEVINCRCTLLYSDQPPNEAGP